MVEDIFLHGVEWIYRDREPPPGWPRTLILMASKQRHPEPEAFQAACARFRERYGWQKTRGWFGSFSCVSPRCRDREWSVERKGEYRRKALRRRLEKKTPLFADQLYEEALARRQAYYAGRPLNEETERLREAALDSLDERYQWCVDHLEQLIEYPHPDELGEW